MIYSKGLVKEYIAYMKRVHRECVSEEQAQLHLKNLSGLFVSISGVKK
jgi:hypothetical protein